jgi:hypothetical protein
LKDLVCDERQMRIHHIAKQKLGAGVDDDDAHDLEGRDLLKELQRYNGEDGRLKDSAVLDATGSDPPHPF